MIFEVPPNSSLSMRSQPHSDVIGGTGKNRNKNKTGLSISFKPCNLISVEEGVSSCSLYLPSVSAALLSPTQMGGTTAFDQVGLPTPLAQ